MWIPFTIRPHEGRFIRQYVGVNFFKSIVVRIPVSWWPPTYRGHEGEQMCREALRHPQSTEPAHRPEDDCCEPELLQLGGAFTSARSQMHNLWCCRSRNLTGKDDLGASHLFVYTYFCRDLAKCERLETMYYPIYDTPKHCSKKGLG